MRQIDAERIVAVLIMNIPGRHMNGMFYPHVLDSKQWEEMRRTWIDLVLQQDDANSKDSIW